MYSPWGNPLVHLAALLSLLFQVVLTNAASCTVRPLGSGLDDTDQVEAAIATCGHFGTTVFEPGNYNITRKMTWDLVSAQVDLHGVLDFQPNIQFWLNMTNTYQVVFIQSQSSWFVVTGQNFVIDAHSTGGINGNGQPWWSFFATRLREDGDGRPISLTLWRATQGVIKNFLIQSPPFWCNAVAESQDIVYDGMKCNATNTDPLFVGQNIVPNTEATIWPGKTRLTYHPQGIDTYRSSNVSLLNWDVTSGDDCLAIKGNSTDLTIRNIICRGGNGIAFGSLGEYVNLSDQVQNVDMENLQMIRLDPNVQPNMQSGVYFKTWTGTVHGSPPTAGGGGSGFVKNVVARNVQLDRVDIPVQLFQDYSGESGDAPSTLSFTELHFADWTGTSATTEIVDLECSSVFGCDVVSFQGFNVTGPSGQAPSFICQNVKDLSGLTVPCNTTGKA